MILESCGHLGLYGLLMNGKYGAAQVKYNFRDKANTSLIAFSMAFLTDEAKTNRYIYNLNYPGIGNGGLDKNIVRPILDILPDNVYVWEKTIRRNNLMSNMTTLGNVFDRVHEMSRHYHDKFIEVKEISFESLETISISNETHRLKPIAQQSISNRLGIHFIT